MKNTVSIRIYESSWKRLKVLAARKGITMVKIIEELSKTK
jgi:predicted DNA-binding ribbon-helix-helix protein